MSSYVIYMLEQMMNYDANIEKHPRIEEVSQEPQNKKLKHGNVPSSSTSTPNIQEMETFERQEVETSIRRFEQEEKLDRPVHDKLSLNSY